MAVGTLVRARQGDTVDSLIWRERGLTGAALAAVLDANPGLSGVGAVLPIGTAVAIPDAAPTADTLPLINLWN